MALDQLFLEQFGGVDSNSLCYLLNNNIPRNNNVNIIDVEPDVMQHSSYHDDASLSNLFEARADVFSILSLNCQSINAKIDQINIKLQQLKSNGHEFSAICLQETWLSEDSDISLLKIDGYSIIPQGKICSAHGGLAIYLSSKYKFKSINMYENSEIWEGQFIEVTEIAKNKSIIIGNIYRPPPNTNAVCQTFINEFIPILEHLQRDNRKVIIAGDFNIDLLKINDNVVFCDYFNSILSQSFFPKITLPTRLTDRSCTLIDNFLCKLSNGFSQSTAGILISRISDHLPYFIFLDYLKPKRPASSTFIKVQTWNDECIHKFQTELNNANIYDMLDPQLNADPTENLTTLNVLISQAKDKHLPTKFVKFNKHKHKKSNWISTGIIRSIKYRDKLYMRLKRVPVDSEMYTQLKTNLKTYQVILKRLIRNAKKVYFQKKFDKFKSDIKNTWQTIKEILNRTSTQQNLPDAFLIDNEMTGDPSIIADKFNNLFANVGRRLSEQLTTPDNVNFKNYLRNPVVPNMSFSQISEEAVMEVLNNLKQKLSCGHDGISSRLLKASKNVICKPLTLIINQTLTSGIFPDTLKIAKIIPLFKKGDRNLLENYRPISILPAISKIFERIMFNQIHSHFSTHNLFYSGQYGFRVNHSTQLAALEVIDRITQDLDQGNTPITIFMDLSKAFDTLNHDILIYKLKAYGLSETALKLMQSYLTNRKQYVEINNTQSTKNDITVGVPQGSILGPLLFIIYINDIIHSSTVFKFIIFADDTTLYTTLDTQENINDILNDELVQINNWLKVNKLSVNVAKTKAMLFHMPQKQIHNPRLTLQ